MKKLDRQHPNYQKTAAAVKMVRDSVEGEVAIKALENQKTYLPDDSECVGDKAKRESRYDMLLRMAEYDNVPASTLGSLIGGITRQPHDYDDIDQSLNYLIDDADGDGASLDELVKLCSSELIQMRYCGLLAEYSDLASLGFDTNKISVEQAKRANLRASIKLYTRESIINWDFKTVNGTKQLSFVVLKEEESVSVSGTLETQMVKSYLLLALDDDGYYYQQRYTEEVGDVGGLSERVYPSKVNGRFDYIPFEFCVAGEYPKGKIPLDCGYLLPICSKSISRYQVSASSKMAMWYSAAPIIWSSGWDHSGYELYKQMTGLEHIASGPGVHVPLPEGSQMGMVDWKSQSSAFETYFERNAKEIEALGGVFDTDVNSDEKTATAKAINAAEKKGSLTDVVDSVEKTLSRIIGYCLEFTGLSSQPELRLNREFVTAKLSPQERQVILTEWQAGLIDAAEALAQLEAGGVLTREASEILAGIETNGE